MPRLRFLDFLISHLEGIHLNYSSISGHRPRTYPVSTVAAFVMSCIAAASGQAQAQESDGTPEELGEITVTGTRITGFTAPTPVTSLSVEDLEVKAVRSVADLMQDIPALRVNFNTGQVSAPLGSSNLDLRGLGAEPHAAAASTVAVSVRPMRPAVSTSTSFPPS